MKDASVYPRAGRPVWYISYRDPTTYERVHRATHHRLDDPEGRGRAYAEAVQRGKLARLHPDNQTEEWDAWVLPFLEQQYRRSPLTLTRYKISWKYWRVYLAEKKLAGPRALTFQHVRDYVDWRRDAVRAKRSGKIVTHNTALADIAAMKVVMGEAVRRGWRQDNPAVKLGILKEPAKEKREIEDHEMDTIVAALDTLVARNPARDWMRIAWEISRWQGCRLSETCFDIRRQVNFRDNTITFHGKGGKTIHTLLHPQLRPYLEKMLKSGRTFTCRFPRMGPAAAGAASKWYRLFLDGLGFHDLSHHCLRTTVITKMARAGVPITQAMAFIGHSDEEVHRIYAKIKPRDLGVAVQAIFYTLTSAQTPGSPGDAKTP
jgi:site-specific recombinase XerD